MVRGTSTKPTKDLSSRKEDKNPLVPTVRTRPINYRPYELSDASILAPADHAWLSAQYALLNVRQYTDATAPISAHTYTVPYKGEKNEPTLFSIAGKRQFDFYAYTFTLANTDWSIMFDHETGLVRTMSVFRALNLEKSTPAEALRATPGLFEIAPNITGGRIPIQGFWMPFVPARELCNLFAGELRAALWPVFGPGILRARSGTGGWGIERALVGRARQRLTEIRAAGERRDSPMEAAGEGARDVNGLSQARFGKKAFGRAAEGRSDREIDAALGLMMLKTRDRVFSDLGFGEFRAGERQ